MKSCFSFFQTWAGSSALLALTCGFAGAADMPLKAPPLAPPVWTAPPVPMFGDFFDVFTRGAFKIADNESPRPTDRVFLHYNYFNNVGGTGTFNVHREIFGVEKTFLDGNASIGMRLPFFQTSNSISTSTNDQQIGDLSVILKYALLNDTGSGNLLSAGLMVTAPTGQIAHAIDPFTGQRIQSAMVQPFVGYNLALGTNFFLHGFSSVIVPTDSRETTLLFNDVGVGYWLYRDPTGSFIRGITPTVEVHINTLLDSGALIAPPRDRNEVNLVFGAHFQFVNGTLGLGVGVPVAGPKPFDAEGIMSFNLRF